MRMGEVPGSSQSKYSYILIHPRLYRANIWQLWLLGRGYLNFCIHSAPQKTNCKAWNFFSDFRHSVTNDNHWLHKDREKKNLQKYIVLIWRNYMHTIRVKTNQNRSAKLILLCTTLSLTWDFWHLWSGSLHPVCHMLFVCQTKTDSS